MKFKELSEESMKPLGTSDNSLTPKLTFIHKVKIAIKSEHCCLKQNITSFRHRDVVNLFIVYELDAWSRDVNNK